MSARTPSSTLLPPHDLEAMTDLSRFLGHITEPAALLGPDGQVVPLPLEAFNALVAVAEAMRQGKAITVAPVDQVLTTQEAADFLGISRPTLVKLLESGEIPYEQSAPGRHRRVSLQDVIDYQQRRSQQRRETLDRMTADASEAGLYEAEVDHAKAAAVIKKRRSRRANRE